MNKKVNCVVWFGDIHDAVQFTVGNLRKNGYVN